MNDFNRTYNRCNICPNCHRNIHEGVVVVEGWFLTMNGYDLIWYKKGEDSFTGRESKPYIIPK